MSQQNENQSSEENNNPFVVLNADDYYGQSVFKDGYNFITNPKRKVFFFFFFFFFYPQ